jgi:uncharacterized protein (TIGR03067 family)
VNPKLFALACFCLVAGPAPAQPPTEKEELQRLQGNWKLVGGNIAGKSLSEAEAASKGMTFTIKGDHLIALVNGQPTLTRTMKLLTHKSPKEIDTVSVGKATKGRGIYALDGDSLKICLREDINGRPVKFAVPDGTDDMLLILKRDFALVYRRSVVTRMFGFAVSPVLRAAIVETQKK